MPQVDTDLVKPVTAQNTSGVVTPPTPTTNSESSANIDVASNYLIRSAAGTLYNMTVSNSGILQISGSPVSTQSYPDISDTAGVSVTIGTTKLIVNLSTSAVTTKNNTLDDGSGNVSIKGVVTSYDTVTTAGMGLLTIVAVTTSATLTGSTSNIINFTPPAVAGIYQITATVANTSSTNTGSTTVTVTYTNVNGTPITATMALTNVAGGNAISATGASTAFYAKVMTLHINASATAITLSTTSTGTVSYVVSAVLMKIA